MYFLKKFSLALFFISGPYCFAEAEIYLTPGVAIGSSYTSPPYLDTTPAIASGISYSYQAYAEWTFLSILGLNVGAGISRIIGYSDYKYTDPANSANTATFPDLSFTGTNFFLSAGFRLSLLNLKYFRFFGGGGGLYGATSFEFDKDDFKLKTGSMNGYKSYSSTSSSGTYLEAGGTYSWNKKNGFQMVYRKYKSLIKKLETVGNQDLNLEYSELLFLYSHHVDLGFFWK